MKKLHTILFSVSLLMGSAAHAQFRVEIAVPVLVLTRFVKLEIEGE